MILCFCKSGQFKGIIVNLVPKSSFALRSLQLPTMSRLKRGSRLAFLLLRGGKRWLDRSGGMARESRFGGNRWAPRGVWAHARTHNRGRSPSAVVFYSFFLSRNQSSQMNPRDITYFWCLNVIKACINFWMSIEENHLTFRFVYESWFWLGVTEIFFDFFWVVSGL